MFGCFSLCSILASLIKVFLSKTSSLSIFFTTVFLTVAFAFPCLLVNGMSAVKTTLYTPLPIISLLVKHLESYSGRAEQSRVVCLITEIFKNAIVLTDFNNLKHREIFLVTCTSRKLTQRQVPQFLELTCHVTCTCHAIKLNWNYTPYLICPPRQNFVYINLCCSFLISITVITREIENNASAKFGGANKVHKIWEMWKWHKGACMCHSKCTVLALFWSENGYRFCPFCCGIIYRFTGALW